MQLSRLDDVCVVVVVVVLLRNLGLAVLAAELCKRVEGKEVKRRLAPGEDVVTVVRGVEGKREKFRWCWPPENPIGLRIILCARTEEKGKRSRQKTFESG